MKFRKFVATVIVLSMVINTCGIIFAEPTEDFHTGPLPGETVPGQVLGPEVKEYYEYKEDKVYSPGSLTGDVDLNTVGKGLFYDGQDFYFFIDTGVMATNFMYNIEGDRFFFGDNGKMVKDELVNYNDEIYYFDINGAMYKNRWYSDEQIDEETNAIIYTDYYFGPTGRAYRASTGNGLIVKTIEDNKYGFNADGEKLEGYYDQNGVEQDPDEVPAYEDCVYYFDPAEDGAACKGWHYYEGKTRGEEYDENEEIVLYFDEKSCKKVAAKANYTNEDRAISRIIEGERYMFDANGVRKNSWYHSEPGRGTNSNAKYFNEEYDGYLQKGWFQAVPGAYAKNGEDLILDINKKRHSSDEDRWFYSGSNGNILRKTIRKIGNYTFAFDDDGVMQEDAFVKVRNGSFVKAYETEIMYRANVLLDPDEYGGNADPDPDGVTNPTSLDKTKGLLVAKNGEQWMYFQGDGNGEAQTGAQAKINYQVKIELNDADIFFIANSTGGYTNSYNGITTPVVRGGIYIQNGVVLRPDPDDNNYGIVRRHPSKEAYTGGTILNYKNEAIDPSTKGDGTYYIFEVVDSKGKPIKVVNRAVKDKTNAYIYIGPAGSFLGYYATEGKYHTRTPGNLIDEDGNPVPQSNQPCWSYKKDGDRKWTYGLPPESERLDPSPLYINFNEKSSFGSGSDYGPYEYGIASLIYEEP